MYLVFAAGEIIMNKYIIILTTIDNQNSAESLAEQLVKSKLAACVQISNIKSYYRWKGTFEKSDEFLLMIKTEKKIYKEVEQFILSNHSYELPEIISIKIEDGFANYFDWVDENLL